MSILNTLCYVLVFFNLRYPLEVFGLFLVLGVSSFALFFFLLVPLCNFSSRFFCAKISFLSISFWFCNLRFLRCSILCFCCFFPYFWVSLNLRSNKRSLRSISASSPSKSTWFSICLNWFFLTLVCFFFLYC
ncbi:unnamed protein product [Moneuplotes crassus]|uniref:Uncharacterized protein n=1 Tax=Euplotes crassus TaxID=5936 RepID=A0AAD1UJM4_EUPCR|nr:unnamed protein product [Moneuplotes crassus]